MFQSLQALLGAIVPTETVKFSAIAQERLDFLTKPKGSLGQLEDIAIQLFSISSGAFPLSVDPALMIVAGGDHGVWAEGVAMQPQEVTHQMVVNIATGGAGISVLSRHAGMDMLVLDAGHKGNCDHIENVKNISFARETKNITQEAAMSAEICEALLLAGANEVAEAVKKGYKLVAIGEMGIANSTPATALFCALYDLDPAKVTGPGAGLANDKLPHKATVVQRALNTHTKAVADKDAFEILRCLGGFEIATLCGVVLGAAALKIPVLIDGFISTSSYAVARGMCPSIDDYAILSHASAEPGYKLVLEQFGKPAVLDMQLRLGEGTGCALVYPIIQAACKIYNEMVTFEEAAVTFIEHENISKRKKK